MLSLGAFLIVFLEKSESKLEHIKKTSPQDFSCGDELKY